MVKEQAIITKGEEVARKVMEATASQVVLVVIAITAVTAVADTSIVAAGIAAITFTRNTITAKTDTDLQVCHLTWPKMHLQGLPKWLYPMLSTLVLVLLCHVDQELFLQY